MSKMCSRRAATPSWQQGQLGEHGSGARFILFQHEVYQQADDTFLAGVTGGMWVIYDTHLRTACAAGR